MCQYSIQIDKLLYYASRVYSMITMAKRDTQTVSFPQQLLSEVDELVENTGKYVSRADFCRQAVHKLIWLEKGTPTQN